MRIAIASGKGGTGKTTVAVNLALSLGKGTLIDCDVEEPNCSVFLDADLELVEEVYMKVPEFDMDKCDYCKECADFCMYNAIAVFPETGRLLFFPELCHGCGGCTILCPREAITERERSIGKVEHATVEGVDFYQGDLNVGEPMATPIIRRVKSYGGGDVILDSPPGNACPVIETLSDSDYAILVTEPTPFGLHDLRLAVKVVRHMDIPFGVVINRHGAGDERVDRYCEEENIPVIMRIPEDRRIAELYSKGVPFVEEITEYREKFLSMYREIQEAVG